MATVASENPVSGGGTRELILMSHDSVRPLESSPMLSIFQNRRVFQIWCTHSKVINFLRFKIDEICVTKIMMLFSWILRHFVLGPDVPAAASVETEYIIHALCWFVEPISICFLIRLTISDCALNPAATAGRWQNLFS